MNQHLVNLARRAGARRASQRGAVAIVVGLTLVVLVGMVGLAIDGGHLYLTKTELQNASDACALAASYNLTGAPAITQASFVEADAAGVTVGAKNKVDFQGDSIANADITVEFGESLSEGSAWLKATSNPSPNSKYVRCTLQRTGITPYLMQVMGFGDQTVKAMATATLAPSQSNCAIPMGLCTKAGSSPPDYGYVKGQWTIMDFSDTSRSDYTGNFRWLDFYPDATTPGCPGGGAQELACLIAGTGQCSLPAPTAGGCDKVGGVVPPGCVGQNGNVGSLEVAYNSRFGVYKGGGGNPNMNTSPPDFTGLSYDQAINWPSGQDAYDDFKAARSSHFSTQSDFYKSPYTNTTQADHTSNGADRRIVVVPIVDCDSFTGGGQHAPIRAYSCVLLLDPYRKDGANTLSKFEYLGLANAPGSPCSSSGVTGDSTSPGPLVPSLVQ